jgi:hypothetical protein
VARGSLGANSGPVNIIGNQCVFNHMFAKDKSIVRPPGAQGQDIVGLIVSSTSENICKGSGFSGLTNQHSIIYLHRQ